MKNIETKDIKDFLEEKLQRPATRKELENSVTDTHLLVQVALKQIAEIRTLLAKHGIL